MGRSAVTFMISVDGSHGIGLLDEAFVSSWHVGRMDAFVKRSAQGRSDHLVTSITVVQFAE